MKLRSVRYSLVVVATAVVVVSLVWMLRSQPHPTVTNQPIVVQSHRPSAQTATASPHRELK